MKVDTASIEVTGLAELAEKLPSHDWYELRLQFRRGSRGETQIKSYEILIYDTQGKSK